jgi:5,10-methylenetetrahydromethanopterin reductase
MEPQIWVLNSASPWLVRRAAQEVEAMGFAGLAVTDSQNKSGDSVVALTLAASVTERIGLATGVTNPYTRHPASLAAAFGSLQVVTGGRMVMGIGRGDSALALLGLSPASPSYFQGVLDCLRGYLSGGDVPFDALPQGGFADAGELNLGDAPPASQLEWLARFPDVPQVPVDVYASGPKIIKMAVAHADRITLAVGADPERIRWARDLALEEAARIGRTFQPGELGALVNISVAEDSASALAKAAGRLAVVMRFSAMHGKAVGPYDEADRKAVEDLVRAYNMNEHSNPGASHATAIRPEFAAKFGLFGTAEYCHRRLQELAELGIGRVVLMAPGPDVDPDFDSVRALSEQMRLTTV